MIIIIIIQLQRLSTFIQDQGLLIKKVHFNIKFMVSNKIMNKTLIKKSKIINLSKK